MANGLLDAGRSASLPLNCPRLPSRLNQPQNCSGTCKPLCDPDLPSRTEYPPAKSTYLPSVIGHVMLRKMHPDLGSVLRFCGLGICGVQSAERGLWWCATMSGECMLGDGHKCAPRLLKRAHHKRGVAGFLKVQQSYRRMPSAPIIAWSPGVCVASLLCRSRAPEYEQASPEPGGFETVRDEPGTRWAPGAIGDP